MEFYYKEFCQELICNQVQNEDGDHHEIALMMLREEFYHMESYLECIYNRG